MRTSHALLFAFMFLTGIFKCGSAYAKEEGISRINSLQQKLRELHKDDTNKVNVLTDLAFEYNRVSPYDGIRIGMQSLELAGKLNWPKGMARANSCLGANYFSLSDYTNAYKYWIDALNINETIGNKKGVANHLHNIGNIFLKQNEYTEALAYYHKALKSSLEIDNKAIITYSYTAIGNVFFKVKNYDSALFYHFKAYVIDDMAGMKTNIAADLLNIGSVYNEQGDYVKAMASLNEAKVIMKNVGDKNGLARAYNKIGNTFISIALYALQTDEGIAKYGDKRGNMLLATSYLDSAITLGSELGYLDNLQQSYEYLTQVYEIQEKYPMALNSYKKFIAIRDSVYSTEKHREIFNLEKKAEIAMRNRAEELERERMESRKYMQVGGVCSFIVIIISVVLILRKRKVSPRVLEVLGAFSVLIIFEFVQLLLHEKIASFTHHNFTLTLICLMVLASLIVPAHHKILHWMKEHLGKK